MDKRKNRILRINLLILLSILLLGQNIVLAATSKNSEHKDIQLTTLKIGAILPITGPVAAYGSECKNGIEMAIDEINIKGGILGKKLELILKDDGANPKKALEAFNEITKKNKVIATIGSLTSTCSLEVAKQAQKNGMIMITPTATNEAVTKVGDCIYRTCYSDPYQGEIIAKYIVRSLKLKNVAVICDATNNYSTDLRDSFKKSIEAMAASVVAEEQYNSGCTDFSKQIERIIASKADILFIPDYYTMIPLIAKELRAKGSTIQIIGPDGWSGIESFAGSEVIGAYYGSHFSSDSNSVLVKQFVANYKKKFKAVPNAMSALGYDSVKLLADAIKRAGTADTKKVKAELAKTNKEFVTGKITFDKNRNPVKSIFMLKVDRNGDNGLFSTFEATVDP